MTYSESNNNGNYNNKNNNNKNINNLLYIRKNNINYKGQDKKIIKDGISRNFFFKKISYKNFENLF